VLVTSRNPVWRGLAGPLAVDVLAREQAVTFLARRTGSQDSGSLDGLAEVLGDLPLALEQASAYIEETVIPIGEYVSLFTERAAELFNLGRASTTEQTIATIWTLSLKQIHNDTPAAQDLLTLCGFLAPDDIPRPLLADHAGKLPERLAEAVADPLSYNQAIGGLRRYSLITATQDALSVHRLVQAVVRNRPDQAAAGQWALAALHLVESAFPSESYEFDNWPECAQLFPHALAVIGYSNDLIGESLAMAALLGKAGLYLWRRAEYTEAQQWLQRALAIRQSLVGPDHLDTAHALWSLALVTLDQGDLSTARSLHERALAIRESHLASDHPDIGWSSNDLAGVLRAQGDLDGSRSLYERALAIREARLGPDHLDTATSLVDLGVVLAKLGRLPAARLALNRALAIYRRRLGPNHPRTITCRRALATLGGQGPRRRR